MSLVVIFGLLLLLFRVLFLSLSQLSSLFLAVAKSECKKRKKLNPSNPMNSKWRSTFTGGRRYSSPWPRPEAIFLDLMAIPLKAPLCQAQVVCVYMLGATQRPTESLVGFQFGGNVLAIACKYIYKEYEIAAFQNYCIIIYTVVTKKSPYHLNYSFYECIYDSDAQLSSCVCASKTGWIVKKKKRRTVDKTRLLTMARDERDQGISNVRATHTHTAQCE